MSAEDLTATETIGVERWPRRYTVVVLSFMAAFVCYIDRVNISVAIIAMEDRFGWSETDKGFILSAFFVGYLLFQVPSGYLSNRCGGKLVLGAAVIWWSTLTIVTPAAAMMSLPMLIAARVALGLGEAATFPAAYNLFSRWVPAAERSRAVSLLLSGVPLGTLFALMTSGWIVERWGWAAVFYSFGALGIVWGVLWFMLISNDVAHHPTITIAERELLRGGAAPPTRSAVPWRLLLTQPAVWALIVNHFCSNWSLYILIAWLPSYFKNEHGLTITNAGLYSAAPWLTMFIVVNAAAWMADTMVRRGAGLKTVRKLMQSVGLLGSAAFLLTMHSVDSAIGALLLMCGALGTLAFTWSGFLPNHLDIAPRYADVVMGLTNTAGTLPGIVGVALTGWLVDSTNSYASAFSLSAGISVVGALIWLAFGTAKRVVD
ncbi:ACS family MFS transporter [Steroidobacter agaridevorans]|uniref:ACS family MFS transporter n=1 Tax=Steroidobacter agaridevorans TaxID=2695856 RepID=UPI00137B44BF|nr:ACS family MFS transporter [Steroidobacter agaridevorans]